MPAGRAGMSCTANGHAITDAVGLTVTVQLGSDSSLFSMHHQTSTTWSDASSLLCVVMSLASVTSSARSVKLQLHVSSRCTTNFPGQTWVSRLVCKYCCLPSCAVPPYGHYAHSTPREWFQSIRIVYASSAWIMLWISSQVMLALVARSTIR